MTIRSIQLHDKYTSYRKPQAWKPKAIKKRYGTYSLHNQLIMDGSSAYAIGTVKHICKNGNSGRFNASKVFRHHNGIGWVLSY